MKYLLDKDLEFLEYCDSKSLDTLHKIIAIDDKGEKRFNCDLPEPHNEGTYWKEVSMEIQYYGGNTISNAVRGNGIHYREILIDVADKMKVNYNKKSETSVIEQNLLLKVLEDSMAKMTEEELKALVTELDLKTTSFKSQAITIALQTAIRNSGLIAYKVALIVANAVAKALVGRGLAFAGNIALVRAIGVFAGPIGWVITGAWTVADIAGPAYRVTIPTVIQVAFLRQQAIQNITENDNTGKI